MVQRYDEKRLISSFQGHLTRNAPKQLRNVFWEVFLHFVWFLYRNRASTDGRIDLLFISYIFNLKIYG